MLIVLRTLIGDFAGIVLKCEVGVYCAAESDFYLNVPSPVLGYHYV